MNTHYTLILISMLLSSCNTNNEFSDEEKLKIVEKQVRDKLPGEKLEKLRDSVKAVYGDSLNYVSDIYTRFENDSMEHGEK